MDQPSHIRRLIAEGLGTALLVFIGVGAVPATLLLNGGAGLTMPDLGVIAFAFAAIIIATAYAFGPISGNHINPAVTLALAVAGRFPWREVPTYVAAQLVGATVGAFAIVGALGPRASELGLGVASFGDETSIPTALIAEFIGTFILVITVLGVIHRRAEIGFAGIAVGVVVAGVIIAIGPSTGGSINPARSTGPMLVQGVLGGEVHWDQLWVYVLAQLLAGVAAAVVFAFADSNRPESKTEAATPLTA